MQELRKKIADLIGENEGVKKQPVCSTKTDKEISETKKLKNGQKPNPSPTLTKPKSETSKKEKNVDEEKTQKTRF